MRRKNAMGRVLLLTAAALALGLILSNQGARRALADRAGGTFRREGRRLRREARHLRSDAAGLAERAAHPVPEPPVDDQALLDRVESEIFTDGSLPKGSVNLDVEGGVVVLRGQLASQAEIDRLKQATLAVPGVKGVLSYLHLPGTPAPNKEAALSASEVAEWREGRS